MERKNLPRRARFLQCARRHRGRPDETGTVVLWLTAPSQKKSTTSVQHFGEAPERGQGHERKTAYATHFAC